jgi:hypothetical protein
VLLRLLERVEEDGDDAVVLLLLLNGLGEAPRRGPARPLLGTPWRVSVESNRGGEGRKTAAD